MVCYARPAGMMAAVVLAVLLVFGGPVAHFFDVAAVMAAIAVAAGGAAVAAVLAFVAFGSIRRRRAASGGCVSCQLRCQHAMTEQPRRLLAVSTADRGWHAPLGGPVAPRWPDRPAYRSGAASRPVAASRPDAASRPADHATATVNRVRDPAAANTGRGSPPRSPAVAPARSAPTAALPGILTAYPCRSRVSAAYRLRGPVRRGLR